jgi:hypothetical protein
MERRRSGRGGWGRDFGMFISRQVQSRAEGCEKPSKLVELTWGFTAILSRNPMNCQELRRYRGLWNLQKPISAAGAIFGRKPRCAARSRDVADGSAACSRSAFRTFPFATHKHRESNPGSQSAIADWTSAFARDDSPADHRSFVVV